MACSSALVPSNSWPRHNSASWAVCRTWTGWSKKGCGISTARVRAGRSRFSSARASGSELTQFLAAGVRVLSPIFLCPSSGRQARVRETALRGGQKKIGATRRQGHQADLAETPVKRQRDDDPHAGPVTDFSVSVRGPTSACDVRRPSAADAEKIGATRHEGPAKRVAVGRVQASAAQHGSATALVRREDRGRSISRQGSLRRRHD